MGRNIMNHKIAMKNARILWSEIPNYNDPNKKEMLIFDLVVAEFNLDLYKEFEKEGKKGSDAWPMNLYHCFEKDFGNCNTQWSHITPFGIILEFFATRRYRDEKAQEHALLEILKIKEVAEEFEKYIQARNYQP